MSIDMQILTDAVSRESAAMIDEIRKFGKDPEDYRGLYARRDLVHHIDSGTWSERWYIGFGSDFRGAVKLSADNFVSKPDDEIASFIADKWQPRWESVYERKACGYDYEPVCDDEALYVARP